MRIPYTGWRSVTSRIRSPHSSTSRSALPLSVLGEDLEIEAQANVNGGWSELPAGVDNRGYDARG